MSAAGAEVLEAWRARLAAARAARTPLRLTGAGTKDFYGETLAGEPFSLTAYRGVIDYEPSELVITARCGTPLSELEATLAAHGQFLAFEPPAFGGDPTFGGVIAAGLSGPRRPYAGAARDFVLGAHLLTAAGEELRFGGQVMKNVAGFDVSRLLCGSLGILGILTQVSVKVLPRPRLEETVRLELPAARAIECFNEWAGAPLPLSAAAWWGGQAWVRLSGAMAAVAAAHARIGGERVGETPAREFWETLRHLRGPLECERLWRLSLPSATAPLPVEGEVLIDWGGALRWHLDPPAGAPLRELAQRAGGSALMWRGETAGPRFHPLAQAVQALHRRLKERFDPHGIFNPGRLLAGL
jgi:glycolate oxidase FAD binding subunit